MKVLVTGAAGGVGRGIAEGLLAENIHVRASSRDPRPARLPEGAEAVRGDLNQPETLREALDGVDAVFFYLASYGAMTLGAFAVLEYLSVSGQRAETMDDLAGLSRTRPGMALLMVLFLFSLMGIPLTAGFMGKFLLFAGALDVPANVEIAASLEQRRLFIGLAVLAAINAAIGGWYYLRIAAVMYLREPSPSINVTTNPQRSWPVLVAVWLCASLTLGIGIYPAPLKQAVQSAVPRLPATTQGMAQQAAEQARDVLADAGDR